MVILFAVVIAMSMAGITYAQGTVTYNLTASAFTLALPDGTLNGTPVLMWGFADGVAMPSVPGPVLVANEGDTLVINLTNNLPDPVTIIIPGQAIQAPAPVMDAGRVRSFVPESGVFTFPNLRAGTYLYESGTNPAKQVQMGLYGALIVRPAAPGQAYNDPTSAYNTEHVVLFSDIDTVMHAAVEDGSFGTASYPSTVNYRPNYFLINGKPYPETLPLDVHNGDITLLRFVNAGLKTYCPMLNGLNVLAIAQDGNLLPYPEEVMALTVTAGQTKDVIAAPAPDTMYALYDRRLNLSNSGVDGVGGMLTYLRSGWPFIDSFTATPEIINVGESSTLEWQTTDATSAEIDQGVGSQPVDGSVLVSPLTTTTYTLTATNALGSTTAEVTVGVIEIAAFTSNYLHDGRVLESRENSNVGGSGISTANNGLALRVGDEIINPLMGERQYKSILSFNTAAIPDTATVVGATLKLTRGGFVGAASPFDTHGTCNVDIKTGNFGLPALENGDFQAPATATAVATMSAPLADGDVSAGVLDPAGLAAINKVGRTQFRVYFSLDDDDDGADDYIGFYSGDDATAANRPVLEVQFIQAAP